jgi:flagellar biosynthetic protein FliR
MQAGYGYASTIDPNSEADSAVLVVFAQLIAGMLFFALGLDRDVLRLFAQTLDRIPPGGYTPGPGSAQVIVRLGATLFTAGVRLALPVVALLLMVDIALGLLGRLNQQLQLVSLAFAVKMLIALLVLSWTASMVPRVMAELSAVAWAGSRRALGL